MATQAPHLVDEILEEIFLRLPTPAELARISTACPRFHGIITERPFLRRFRKLHPPPLLGLAYRRGFLPVQAPHPSAPLARAFADAADFTYSFLPKCSEEYWAPCDARDGRVLLEDTGRYDLITASFTNLAVCDPLSMRYVLLPPIPEEMTAQQDGLADFGPKLVPIGEDEDETSFKVVCRAHYQSKLIVFVFSSVSGEWCIAASISWSSLGEPEPDWDNWSWYYYAHGCLYWTNLWSNKLLVLDMDSMEFSTIDTGHIMQLIDLPDQIWRAAAIVDGTKAALEMFTLVRDHTPAASFRVCHTIQENNGESSDEWKLKSIIALPLGSSYFIVDATERFLFLQSIRQLESDEFEEYLISVEVKTSELMKLRGPTSRVRPTTRIQSYFGFPLSKPSL